MTLRILMAIGVVAFAMTVTSEVSAQKDADKLRAIERERLRSLVDADVATARRLHADDFQLVNPLGGTLSKEQYVGAIASGALDYILWQPGEMQVRLYRDSAVLRYKAQLKVTVNGRPAPSGSFWHIDLYEKRNGTWQVVWSQATQIQDQAPAFEPGNRDRPER